MTDPGNPQLVTPDSNGAAGSGHYRATIVMPVGSVAGLWTAHIRAIDKPYNQDQQYATVNVVDTKPIAVTDIPRLIDGVVTATPTPSTLTVRLHLQSTRDEVRDVWVGITNPGDALGGFNLHLSSGTDTDGVWQETLNVPSNDIGNWSLNGVGIIDRLGVTHEFPDSDLAKITGRTWTTA